MDEVDIGSLDSEAFADFLLRARIEARGFVPGDLVEGRTLRVEKEKRKPTRKLTWLVLDVKGDELDALGPLKAVDKWAFVAEASARSILVYRTTNESHGLLSGDQRFRFNDTSGTRSVSEDELNQACAEMSYENSPSPFTSEAHHDQSLPLVSLYSLLLERGSPSFSQEVYAFLARSDHDAMKEANHLAGGELTHPKADSPTGYLYFSGFSGPDHGSVIFEHSEAI